MFTTTGCLVAGVHEAVYREHGFALTEVLAAPPAVRADLVESAIAGLTGI